jgi:MFS family permease
MALIGMAFGFGFTLGPVIGAFLASEDPAVLSPLPGFVAAGLSLAALLLAVARLPETLRAGATASRPWFNLEGWRMALGNRGVAVPLVTFFVSTLAFAMFESILALFAKHELDYTLWEMGFLFAYVGCVLMLTQGLIVRRIVSRVGEVAMMRAGITLMLAGLITVALVMSGDALLTVLGPMALAVAGFACLTPSAQALISRRSSVFHQGEILGVNQAAAAIARILGPLLGNVLFQLTHMHTLPYYAGAGLLGMALLLALTLRPDAPELEARTTHEPT